MDKDVVERIGQAVLVGLTLGAVLVLMAGIIIGQVAK